MTHTELHPGARSSTGKAAPMITLTDDTVLYDLQDKVHLSNDLCDGCVVFFVVRANLLNTI
jgi:hypothetical protein